MAIDLTSLLGNFILAATVYALLKSHLDYLAARVKELEDELERSNEAHKKDLRQWAGISQGSAGIEEDTRRFISAEKQRKLREEWEKRQSNLADTD